MDFITRTETKYLVHVENFNAIRDAFSEYLEKDKYYFYKVHNIYFDNADNQIISHSIEAPEYKEKLRMRMYEHPGAVFQDAYIELKKKYLGVVYKRRKKLDLDAARQAIAQDVGCIDSECQVMREILFYMKKTACYPKIYLSYERYSYYATEDSGLRVTFDTNIVSRRENLKFASSKEDSVPLLKNHMILEIKTCNYYPLWLIKILNDYKIYPTSFSKYGKIFEAEKVKEAA